MYKFILAIVVAIFLLGMGSAAWAFDFKLDFGFGNGSKKSSKEVKHLLVLLDISNTAPLTVDRTLSLRSADFVANIVESMKSKSTIRIGYIGSLMSAQNLKHNFRISLKHPRLKVKKRVKTIVASTYDRVNDTEHPLEIENTTEILGQLYLHSQNKRQPTSDVVIISDGLEFSSLGNFYNVGRGKPVLYDEIPADLISGANVWLIGLGYGWKDGNDAKNIYALEQQWRSVFSKMGANDVTIITRDFDTLLLEGG